MSIVFEKSNTKAAFHSLIDVALVLLVGGTLGVLLISKASSSTFLKIIGMIVLLLSTGLLLRTLRETKSYLNNKDGWRVEIADGFLSWSSPVPEFLESFKIKLVDIMQVREEILENVSSENSPNVSFYIDLKNGDEIHVNYSFASIYPGKVFKALSQQGIQYKKVMTRRYSYRRTEKTEELVE